MHLADLNFTDLYLGENTSWMTGVLGAPNPAPIPSDMDEALAGLRLLCLDVAAKSGQTEFTVKHSGIIYRVSSLPSQNEMVFVLRRFPAAVPRLQALGLHPTQFAELMRADLTGLVIIAGAFGQGKTTTASALVASRLEAHGGVAVTVEDPPEMPLEGRYGAGVCYQTRSGQGQFGQSCRHVARWAPNIIFIGEVRDYEPASEALRAAINGSLVVCTLHADNVISAVERMYALASSGQAGDSGDVASLLAQGLAVVMHQTLEGRPPKLQATMLSLRGESGQGIRSTIKARKFDQLGTTIDLQRNRMRNNGNNQRGNPQ